MSWDAYHRRRDVVRVGLMRAAGDNESAAEVLRYCDPDGEVFDSQTEFLRDVQMAWFQCLSGELDRSRYLGSRNLDILVAHAWAQTAVDMPAARRLLDSARSNPDLAKAFAKENDLLTVSAGCAGGSSAEHAAKIRELADGMHVAPRKTPSDKTPSNKNAARQGVISRVKEALAA